MSSECKICHSDNVEDCGCYCEDCGMDGDYCECEDFCPTCDELYEFCACNGDNYEV